jgi:hypothetical protein
MKRSAPCGAPAKQGTPVNNKYYHAIFAGNPHKGCVVNVSIDVPKLPISKREKQE